MTKFAASETRCRSGAPAARVVVCAFTLIELMVVIAIVGVLLALVLPMGVRTIGAARSFKCQMSLRSVVYDFRIFADDALHGDRGDDRRDLGDRAFRLETFQDSQYCVDEFWCWPDEDEHQTPDRDNKDPMRCAEVDGPLTLVRNAPCVDGGVTPLAKVSFGFNARLKDRERGGARPVVSQIRLTSDILTAADVPLIWDIDATEAIARDESPFYSAPALDSMLLFAGNRLWFPGLRHNGALNAGFIDGSVRSSTRPLDEAWRWGYVPGE